MVPYPYLIIFFLSILNINCGPSGSPPSDPAPQESSDASGQIPEPSSEPVVIKPPAESTSDSVSSPPQETPEPESGSESEPDSEPDTTAQDSHNQPETQSVSTSQLGWDGRSSQGTVTLRVVYIDEVE